MILQAVVIASSSFSLDNQFRILIGSAAAGSHIQLFCSNAGDFEHQSLGFKTISLNGYRVTVVESTFFSIITILNQYFHTQLLFSSTALVKNST